MFRRIKQFFKDVIAEFKRVQWPTKEATIRSTSVVVAVSLVITTIFHYIASVTKILFQKAILSLSSLVTYFTSKSFL